MRSIDTIMAEGKARPTKPPMKTTSLTIRARTRALADDRRGRPVLTVESEFGITKVPMPSRSAAAAAFRCEVVTLTLTYEEPTR